MIIDPLTKDNDKINQHDKQEIIEFWEYMESLLDSSKCTSTSDNVANSCLVNFLKIATDKYKDFITSDKDIYRISLMLTESQIFEKRREFCISKLLSLLNIDLLELNMKFIISYILLFETKKDINSLEIVMKYQGFTVIYNTLYTQFAYLNKYGETERSGPSHDIEFVIIDEMKQISTVLMDILYQIFKFCKCSISNVQLADDFFVHFMITSVRSDTLDDIFNNSMFKLLLSLNEQYMMFNKDYSIENKVLKYLVNLSVNKNFTELLLLQFNRTKDSTLQIMMCKMLYLILSNTSNSIAERFFYLNDLNVFVDVLIRELQDISEQDEILRNTLLRVLIPLLRNTELNRTHYRCDDLNHVLKYLCDLDNICSEGTVLPEHRLTVKLAFKCLNEVSWLGTNDDNDDVASNHSRASSITAMAMSFSRRRTDISENSVISYTSNGAETVERDPNRDQFYHLGTNLNNNNHDISAESLYHRKNKPLPPPPPPPSRKALGGTGRNEAVSYMMGVRQ